jgi:hypothetical protein
VEAADPDEQPVPPGLQIELDARRRRPCEGLLLPTDPDVAAESHRVLRLVIDQLAVQPQPRAMPVVQHKRNLAWPRAMQVRMGIGGLIRLVAQRFAKIDPVEFRRSPVLVIRLLLQFQALPNKISIGRRSWSDHHFITAEPQARPPPKPLRRI